MTGRIKWSWSNVILGRVSSLCWIGLLIAIVILPACQSRANRIPFDQKVWLSEDPRDEDKRLDMVHDLCPRLEGMKRDDVEDLLGKCHSTDSAPPFDIKLYYKLGADRYAIAGSLDDAVLVIGIRDGRVAEVWQTSW